MSKKCCKSDKKRDEKHARLWYAFFAAEKLLQNKAHFY
jgi:hypothetical protein